VFLDGSGKERYRIEGYLPRREFAAQLTLVLGRIAFMQKRWAEAEEHYNSVASECGDTASAAEAIYWSGVAHYKKTNDHTVLGRAAQQLAEKYRDNLWTKRAAVWLPAAPQAKTA
jgi:TolA-binding protein